MANFAVDVVERAAPDRLAIVELARDGTRREWFFGEVALAARTFAGHLHAAGTRRGDVVLTLVGNQPDWVAAIVMVRGARSTMRSVCSQQCRTRPWS